ncbi:MAG: glycerophosphodiester phosphodiesterase family protein, partial [Pseudomonadota bacterium]
MTQSPFAHRGLHHGTRGIAENSLTAFRGAIKQKIGIELDVRLSVDGEAMVFHDEMLDRLTAQTGPMAAQTAQALGAIRLFGDADDHIPSLTTALSIIRGQVPVLVEMKDVGDQNFRLCVAVRRALEGYGGPIAIMSFNPDIPAWFAKSAPQITRGLVTTEHGKGYGVFGTGKLA